MVIGGIKLLKTLWFYKEHNKLYENTCLRGQNHVTDRIFSIRFLVRV